MEDEVREAVLPGDEVVSLSARLEQEAARLEEEDRDELYSALGLGEGALATVVRSVHRSLGLITFYTLGPKEARAWTVEEGATAPRAAGKIHSDLERGFIRAEVASLPEVLSAGGWENARREGKVRVEGKDYRVRDEDVLLVRFSV